MRVIILELNSKYIFNENLFVFFIGLVFIGLVFIELSIKLQQKKKKTQTF